MPSLLTWITEKELKNRGDEFCSKKNMKIGGEKMRNANGQQGENRRRSEKKRTGTQAAKPLVSTYDISFIRYVVSRCSRAKQLHINVQKSVLHVQSCYCCCCCLFVCFCLFLLT